MWLNPCGWMVFRRPNIYWFSILSAQSNSKRTNTPRADCLIIQLHSRCSAKEQINMGAPRAEKDLHSKRISCFSVCVCVFCCCCYRHCYVPRFKQRARITQSMEHDSQCKFQMCVECMLFHMCFFAITLNIWSGSRVCAMYARVCVSMLVRLERWMCAFECTVVYVWLFVCNTRERDGEK